MLNTPVKIGILGGTFNPIHNAHIEMALGAKKALGLHQVMLIPANAPPHKQTAEDIPAEDRYAMTRLAVKNIKGLRCSDIEVTRAGKSYTVDTLTLLIKQNEGALFYAIVGSDMLRDLQNWHEAEKMLGMAVFIGIKREEQSGGEEEAVQGLRQNFGADVRLIPLTVPAVSSTVVRSNVRRARPIGDMVCADVERYIYGQALYFPKPLREMHQKVKAMLEEDRFSHTVGVMLEAVSLAARYGANTQKARLCALLHDCGRGGDKGALTHAAFGGQLAEELFHIRDEEALRAIRMHTTLGKGATTLMKIIYLADMIEPNRVYEGVSELREAAKKDLDLAVELALSQTIAHVKKKGKPVHPDSIAALCEIKAQHS